MTLRGWLFCVLFAVSFTIFSGTGPGWAKTAEGASSDVTASFQKLEASQVANGPVIDGVLNDAAWQRPPLPLGEWLTYNPTFGNPMAQRTTVWAVSDNTGLYFAYHCTDPDPEKIKTSISRRDTTFNDDWIGLSLDSLGGHQSAIELFVNPDGIQSDILNSSTSGEDPSPDWVWQSAAKRTKDGYDVEIKIPYKSIRFKSGAEVRMEVLFLRRVSRLGTSASWPNLEPGKSIFTLHAPLIVHDVRQPLTLEVIPNGTYSFNQFRSAPDRWRGESDPKGGVTAKYGITSTVTLDGTIYPDFSQVESDAFQMEVNQRYPIFYSEKRPFFMEGMGTFNLAGVGGDANMMTAVHTRRIVDPLFGVKVTGTVGKVTFGTLSSSDRSPGNADQSDPLFEKKQYFNIARALYSVGKGSYVGGLATDTELGAGHNRVVAGDLSLFLGSHQQLSATAIATDSRDPDGSNSRNGMAGQASYSYSTKRRIFITQLEHYDKDFRMDTAFYNRTGITTNWTYYSQNFYPDEKRYPWFKKFSPFVWVHAARDRIQGGNEYWLLGGVRMNFTRQGFFRLDYGKGQEAWAGRTFHNHQIRVMGEAQLYRWLNLSGYASLGRSIFYDPDDPFSGNSKNFHMEAMFQPGPKLSQTISYDRALFNRISDGSRVFTVDIINTKTTYQFNRRFSLRAIERYDSSRKCVMMDYLASYEPIPGTVAYAGYGALFDRQEWDGSEFKPGQGEYLNTQRGVFLKVSYLYRF